MIFSRLLFYFSWTWVGIVSALACIEYSEGAAGYGITTRAVMSKEAVGFVATHPIFATTVHADPSMIAMLMFLPIVAAFAFGWALKLLKQSFSR